MPKQVVGQSPLLAKLGRKGAEAFEKHKADETRYGQVELPAGIEHGIAQLVDCSFKKIAEGKQYAGEYMFWAVGIVKSPDQVKGVPVQGLRTTIMEMLCDTPGRSRQTVEEHLAWVLNEMRKLGVNTAEVGPEDLEAVAAALKEEKPHFRFRTWAGAKQEIRQRLSRWYCVEVDETGKEGKAIGGPYPSEAAAKQANPFAGREPRTNHQWNGIKGLENYTGAEAVNGQLVDETGAVEDAGTSPTSISREFGEAEAETGEDAPAEDLEFGDLDSLVAIASEDKETDRVKAARARLIEMALEAGASQEEVDKAPGWQDVADLIAAARADADAQAEQEAEAEESAAADEEAAVEPEPEPEPEKPLEPAKEQIWLYKPIDPKTKKPFVDPKTKKEKKPIEVEITAVDKKTRTVVCKSLDDPKAIYKGVKWDALISG